MTDIRVAIPTDPDARLMGGRPVWVLVVASFTAFLGGINQGTLNVALPVIAVGLGSGPTATSWILLSYLVGMVGTILVFGRVADMIGRRRVFLAGMTLFAVSSALSALAPGAVALIAGRALQGIAAAMMFATGAAMIAAVYPPRRLGSAMGIFFAVNSVAQIVGPVLGGIIVSGPGWRWLFWVNVPIAVAAYLAGLRVLPRRSDDPRSGGFDWAGAGLSVAAIVSGVAALSTGNERGWTSPLIVVLVLVAAVSLVVFLWWERRFSFPILDLSLFTDRVFRWANVSSFLSCAVRFPLILLIALMFQTVHALGPAVAGLAVVPLSIGTMLAALAYGVLERWFSHYWLGVAGSLVTVVGVLLLLPTVSGSAYLQLTAVGGFVSGTGTGILLTANGAALLLDCDRSKLGVISGVRALLQMLGNVIGVAGCLVVLAAPLSGPDRSAVYSRSGEALGPGAATALGQGFQIAFTVLAVVALLGALASAAARSHRSANDGSVVTEPVGGTDDPDSAYCSTDGRDRVMH
ncbi:MFS transporter [Rhodococcus sp. NPDC127528]|uniref:MFS transporter n=1 Tax=unclassified Rhodococcus (in: high G+C Gram-positive bacteria) TaxID=192944 RepID=UPI0036257922